jgi:hypothetical protein
VAVGAAGHGCIGPVLVRGDEPDVGVEHVAGAAERHEGDSGTEHEDHGPDREPR